MPGLTIIIPWFGTTPAGGAQRLAGRLAMAMSAAGWRVTVATTTSEGHWGDWGGSHFAEGESGWPADITPPRNGVDPPTVVRFRPDARNVAIFNEINGRLLHQRPLTLAEEESFFRESINSTPLLEWVATERPDDLVVTLPYCYGLTFFATLAFARRCVLVPCLHREAYARMLHTAEILERAAGLAFLSPEEEGIARAVADIDERPRATLGMWVDGADRRTQATSRQADDDERRAARERFVGDAETPYLAVVGWQDAAKGIGFLYECYDDLLRSHVDRIEGPAPRLVLAGPGHVPLPPGLAGDEVRHAGMLDEESKRALVRGAEWLVQPSLNESFSLVLMEAWREGTPALVNALCAVTRGHCVRSGGGLYFANGEELAEAIAWGRRHPREQAAMGRRGAAYVAEHYATAQLDAAWDAFLRSRLEQDTQTTKD